MHNQVITLAREFGSGGRLIGKRLSELLQIPFYDREVIVEAARKTGLSEDYISEAEQKKSHFIYNLSFSPENLPLSDQVFLAQAEVIRAAAQQGPCVIVGRCADDILREYPGRVSVFIHAPLEQRVRRAREVYHVEAADVKSDVLRRDKQRAAYYNYFTNARWGQLKNYDMALDSSVGIEQAAQLICQLVKFRGDRN
ncbi:cytidylate kinase-like family protein [Christensenellaceae bacterium NSJ-44]|uniref:Cytidylate kinase-like family protein n=1 Tax=Luoshenia tenuis TaxID=2763654 RepID=A0A926CYL0_9FIRM|nr:cytidylate kinase-like family protein [Luoshenia tenuis]MBC8529105.1 cytidylate kinase-like family protein [Luoshenia tenuis]